MARNAVGSAEAARVATFAKVYLNLGALEVEEPRNPRLSLHQVHQPGEEDDLAKEPPSSIRSNVIISVHILRDEVILEMGAYCSKELV